MNAIDYSAQVTDGNGDYGTYTGTLLHLTLEYGSVPCGHFKVNVRPGEFFPEATRCYITLTKDSIPYRRVWGNNGDTEESVKDLAAHKAAKHTCDIGGNK